MAKKFDKKFDKDFNEKWHGHMHGCHHAGAGYGLGFIGAAVYFISQATTFWMGVLGFLKALVWPAYIVYGLLKVFGL